MLSASTRKGLLDLAHEFIRDPARIFAAGAAVALVPVGLGLGIWAGCTGASMVRPPQVLTPQVDVYVEMPDGVVAAPSAIRFDPR